MCCCFFFFKQKTAYEMRISDWSSDVCSSDLVGDNVVVFGLGGIGLNVIQGARLAGAKQIIGVDINPDREEWGRKFGMTDFLNTKDMSREDTVAAIVQLTDGGADYTFDAPGNTEVMRTALEACHRGWGTSIILGVAEAGKEIATRPFQLVTGRNRSEEPTSELQSLLRISYAVFCLKKK